MSEEFSDDFVVEEEESANRSFLIAAGSLIGVFIILAACLLVYVLMQRGQEQSDAIAQIESQNATTEAQNALVTQTVEAQETQSALAVLESENATAEAERLMTALTAEAVQTQEALPTATPPPTQVVQQPEAAATDTPMPTLASGGNAGNGSGTGTGGLATPITPGAGETLPQTGISIWGFAIAGLGLLAVLVLARRLRTA